MFRAAALLGSLLIIEVLSCLALKLFGPAGTTLARLHQSQHNLATGTSDPEGLNEVIHPYLGWVSNPQVAPPEKIFGREIPVNRLGFLDEGQSVHERSKDTFIVAILGGSVAWHTGIAGTTVIRETLEADPRLEGKTVTLVILAKSGYKQPQQLLAYNYLTSLGAEFDAVVNIDGYNEVALSVAENYHNGTSIAYPRAWHARVIQLLDPRISAETFQWLQWRAHRQSLARTIDSSVLKWSWTGNLIWFLRNRRADSKIAEVGSKVALGRSERFVSHGPPDHFGNHEEMQNGVVDLWYRSSLQLHHCCQPTGTIYIHLLQPNQHHLGSKPMGPEERLVAYTDREIINEDIRDIYPLVIESGKELKRQGVQFSDQTMLFAELEETIYSDSCCHYNEKGNILLAEQVAQELLIALGKK